MGDDQDSDLVGWVSVGLGQAGFIAAELYLVVRRFATLRWISEFGAQLLQGKGRGALKFSKRNIPSGPRIKGPRLCRASSVADIAW